MADKDITIPMGPDRTGEIELPPIDFGDAGGEVKPAADPLGEPAPEPAYVGTVTEPQGDVSYAGFNDAKYEELAEKYDIGGISEEQANAQGMDDVQMSFLALKDSIGQGRELKAREKELDEFTEKLDADKEELADREDILANYQVLVTDLDNVIAQHTEQREARKSELAQITAQLEETTEALHRMREYHDGQMDPFEKNLGRARASADQAKNDERSRKSELSAAESELKRASSGDDTTMATARLEQVQAAYDEARARSEAAKEALDQAQRAYDDAIGQVEQAEAPLEHTIEDCEKQAEELKASINRLGEDISIARKRRQYCDTVYQYPEETAKLRDSVRADEQKMIELDTEADDLRNRLAMSKERSKKAKGAIIIGGIIVVVIIVILIMVFVR